MNVRFLFLLCAAAALLAAEPTAAQVEIVPRDTIRPRDTQPWVPADTLAAAEVRHVVKPGDTLWGLARQYLNDPYRWPDVFRRNADVVEHPHWIYPGEVLRMPATAVRPVALRLAESEGMVVSRVVTRTTAPQTPAVIRTLDEPTVFAPGGTAAVRALASVIGPQRATPVRQGEIDAAPIVVGERGPVGAGRIVGSADREHARAGSIEHRFQLNDHAYVQPPPGAPSARGAMYLVLAAGPTVLDSARAMIPTGVLRVVEPVAGARPAKARLVRQFGEVFVGQALVPYVATAVQRGVPTPVTATQTSRVAWIQNTPVLPSLQHYLVLSLPRSGSVEVGDHFTLIDQTTLGSRDSRNPPESAAVVEVVRVTPFGATAMIVAQRLPTIVEGMQARLTARLR